MDLVALRRRNRPLADYIEDIAEQPLSFRGAYPIDHSAANHRHLWMIEAEADGDATFDLGFRIAAVAHILGRWRDRLPSYAPARAHGFRLYLYSDLAPTVSVVAETRHGCPYGGDLTFVARIDDVLEPYAGRSWMANFVGDLPSPERIMKAAAKVAGSLRGTAVALRLPLAEVRRLIESYGIAREFNAIRKRHGRRPAAFAEPDLMLPKVRIWEWRLVTPRRR